MIKNKILHEIIVPIIRILELVFLMISIFLIIPPVNSSSEVNLYSINGLCYGSIAFLLSRLIRNKGIKYGIILSLIEVLIYAAVYWIIQIILDMIVW